MTHRVSAYVLSRNGGSWDELSRYSAEGFLGLIAAAAMASSDAARFRSPSNYGRDAMAVRWVDGLPTRRWKFPVKSAQPAPARPIFTGNEEFR